VEQRSQGVNEARPFASSTHMTDSVTLSVCHMTQRVSDATHALLPLASTVTNNS